LNSQEQEYADDDEDVGGWKQSFFWFSVLQIWILER